MHKEFLHHFMFDDDGFISIAEQNPSWTDAHKKIPETIDTKHDVYFGPAMRKQPGDEKHDVLGTKVLWVDVDDLARPLSTLPPSLIVFSGHGWHLYWILDKPVLEVKRIEELNKILAADVPTADASCFNANRVLRIPGTVNEKDLDKPVPVSLRENRPHLIYSQEDLEVVGRLNSKTRHKISTGDKRGFRSRSERDWSIVQDLLASGASKELIHLIFDNQPCGDKHLEGEEHYLERTIEKAAEGTVEKAVKPIDAKKDGYYMPARNGTRRVSTFTFEPKYLLDGSSFDAQDALVCNVHASDYIWEDVAFSRAAFTGVSRLDKECPVAAWQWLGSDRDLRQLLPHLLLELEDKGLPRIAATPIMGLHKIKDTWYFVGDKHTISADQIWKGFDAPIAWLPTKREHPEMDLGAEFDPAVLPWLAETLPKLHAPEAIWPMIGWYAASFLKPWIEEQNYRFPILNVSGTKGSGKTTLIQRVFMPLFGQASPKTYDSGTTRFVTLALMGSTSSIPIAFSEFRYGHVEHFIRFILLAYDTGHDPRGRADQTTQDYPLSTPFTLDGEDLVEDPAARERIVVGYLHPDDIAEGSDPYKVFKEFRESAPDGFGRYFIQQGLKRLTDLPDLLKEASDAMFEVFPSKLPDRVRNNYIVTYFGMLLWREIVGGEVPDPNIFKRSIKLVYDFDKGRARTFADTMSEDIVNQIANGSARFNAVYNSEENILWFQMAPTHTWWLASRRRQGRGALERDAMRMQFKEAPYSVEPQVISDAWMYGIDLTKAHELGLDVPLTISEKVFVIRLKKED